MVGRGITSAWIAAASKMARPEDIYRRRLPECSRIGSQSAGFYAGREGRAQDRDFNPASKPHSISALPATSLYPRGFLPRGQSDSSPLKFLASRERPCLRAAIRQPLTMAPISSGLIQRWPLPE